MRILVTAGGTGGHIYPAIAIANAVMDRKPRAEILFITGTKDIERKIIGDAGFELRTIPVKGLPRKISPAFLGFTVNLGVSVVKSLKIIKRYKPSLLLATGGYVSGPPVVAAWILGVPIFMQEQNSYPGVTTRKLARFSVMVFLGYETASRHLGKNVKTIVAGNPVRGSIVKRDRRDSAALFGLDPDIRTILIFGGSQGAQAINKALSVIVDAIAYTGIQVLWQTGMNDCSEWRRFDGGYGGRIRVLPYIDDMGAAYSASDLIVSRAGAITIAEITACGLPALFIPFPLATANHQEHNARALVEAGAAVMILESDLTPERLKNEITGIITSCGRLLAMSENSKKLGRSDAAFVIAGIMLAAVGMN